MQLVIDQLIAAYEAEPGGVETVEALANAFGLEKDVVAALLQQRSAVYRVRQDELRGAGRFNNNPLGEHPADEVPDEVYRKMHVIIQDIAMNSQDERTRLRAAFRVIDEKKGRLDKHAVANTNVAITIINQRYKEQLAERELRRQAREAQPALEVTTTNV